MLEWPILKQIFDLCFTVMRFIYDNISPNVGVAIILYALFVHALFIPFSIKSYVDKKRNAKAADEIKSLKNEFAQLSEEDRANAATVEEFKERERKLKKKRVSIAESCSIAILRMFILVATTPVVIRFEELYNNYLIEKDVLKVGDSIALNHNFLGFDLNAPGPGFTLSLTLIFPLITTLVLSAPGFISTIRNMRDRAAAQAAKTPEELAEEKRMLTEMGIKDNKIPWGIIIQSTFTLLYFWSFSKLALTASLFWGAYYIINFGVKGVLNYVSVKIAQQLRKRQGEKCPA